MGLNTIPTDFIGLQRRSDGPKLRCQNASILSARNYESPCPGCAGGITCRSPFHPGFPGILPFVSAVTPCQGISNDRQPVPQESGLAHSVPRRRHEF